VLLNVQQNPTVTATLIPVKTRADERLDAKTLNDQLVANTQDDLKHWRVASDDLLLAESPQNAVAVTCIRNGQTGTTSTKLVERQLGVDATVSLQQRLMIIAGLRRPRNLSCLWVRITSETTESLQTAWRQLAPTLRGAY
jgi:hypothetical protein